MDQQHSSDILVSNEAVTRAGSSCGKNSTNDTGDPLSLSPYLVPLADNQWAFWRWSCLRGAGFPVSQVLQLADLDCVAGIELFFQCEEELDQIEQTLQAQYDDLRKEADREQRNYLYACWNLLSKYRFEQIAQEQLPVTFRALIQRYQASYERLIAQWTQVQQLFEAALARSLAALSQAARDPRLREAVLWQNADAVVNSFEPFLRNYPAKPFNNRQRKNAYLITKYLTRYCTKNDSIGFFGPVGWAQWQADASTPISVEPGPQLLSQRNVFFETWGIDMLGELLARDPALRPWARPRPMPALCLDGNNLLLPFGSPVTLSPLEATVFAACNGQRSAREIVQQVVEADSQVTPDAIYTILETFHNQQRLCWSFEVSMEGRYPEQALRHLLQDVQPVELRQRACESLDLLEQKRAAVSAAAGNQELLAVALADLNQAFSACTQQSATRLAGEMYAARTLAYEDCQRDIQVTLGPSLQHELEQPLLLLVKSARWFTAEAARRYAHAYFAIYRDLVQKTGSARVNFVAFWSWMQPLMDASSPQAPIHEVILEFQQRWAHILQLPDGQSHVNYSCAELRSRVEQAFAASAPGWRGACYHSPDILISASDPAAIANGEYSLVLGEFHQAINTMDGSALVGQHPDPDALIQAFCHDLPDPLIIPLAPRHFMRGNRTQQVFMSEKDWRFVYGTDTAGYDPQKTLLYGNLVLEEQAGELVVSTRDGQQQFPLLHVLEGFLSPLVCDHWQLLPVAQHTPRISFDRLVICREAWRFLPEELPFLSSQNLLEEYTELRRWIRENSLPRFLFVRISGERKPFYVDTASPISVQILIKALRQVQTGYKQEHPVVFSEMLPDPEHAWLMDAQNNHYTSELRVVIVDRAGRTPTDNL
ncbi:hypothetical protein KDW_42920 [Dictyobacter vulcani]|uniref:Lantibiotic dehydratase N-terminal domain-containing protein n=1 Tax=Dictyobacter vulcani TaxID=2607529 RepID=A0A5J4KUI0_9CHLR|nr:lantibiotic dehydratase [Dictyobacter vulcani]GER90130.1 hypothetical protein KDW_42920 [Dictyobacter vulcani]